MSWGLRTQLPPLPPLAALVRRLLVNKRSGLSSDVSAGKPRPRQATPPESHAPGSHTPASHAPAAGETALSTQSAPAGAAESEFPTRPAAPTAATRACEGCARAT